MVTDYYLPEDTPPQATGSEVLHNPSLNKGTAFTKKEREVLRLRGLLPPRVFSQEGQVNRVLENLRRKPSDIEKYIYLMALQDRNEALFFRVIIDHIEEMMPLIYTPTVGQACQEYGHIFRRPRGLFISADDVGQMKHVVDNWYHDDVSVIVVTDGERILGLGDLGANGMGIPVGKLALYTACAGIAPQKCLPITLDVGTNNETLLNDPLYIGLPQRRLTGASYDAFIEEFIQAIQARYPNALIQFEDFGNHNAFRLLERYRNSVCTFNDDIQGTASVALAGLLNATKVANAPLEKGRYLFFGAGEAGIGTADLLVTALERRGLSHEEAVSRCIFVDSKGLVVANRDDLNDNKRRYATQGVFSSDLEEIISRIEPTALIGVSGQAGKFTTQILQMMARLNPRPIIFALSNPTSRAECTAEAAYTYTEGRAVFASGSPFAPVVYNGKRYDTGQANNAYIFPAIGLGVVASGAKRVTDEMFFVAAQTLADLTTPADLADGNLFPPLAHIRKISAQIAVAVAKVAAESGLSTVPTPHDWLPYVEALMYDPSY
jgi:malate dehydrogenase (oxaloacetate-decarboxylating)(NADP+)